jgi:hypothetical protein
MHAIVTPAAANIPTQRYKLKGNPFQSAAEAQQKKFANFFSRPVAQITGF